MDVDIVIGICYVNGGGVYGWDLWWKLMSWGVNVLVYILLWFCVFDLIGFFR